MMRYLLGAIAIIIGVIILDNLEVLWWLVYLSMIQN